MNGELLDICIVTYNRLEYLRRCVWSIIMSTTVPYRLFVLSDHSLDGTEVWMREMRHHSKIYKVLFNESNMGTAYSFNRVIRDTESSWFVQACDDMYFHRGWDKAAIGLTKEFDDCGMASFWDFPKRENDTARKPINDNTDFRQSTGLACTLMNRDLFNRVGGYVLPEGIKMGYFAKGFCKSATELGKEGFTRWRQYLTVPEYAVQMDRTKRYSQEYLYQDYAEKRNKEKRKFKGLEQ